MEFLEKTGKNVDEAVNNALKELGCTMEEVNVTVVQPGSKGFLGLLGNKKSIVRVSRKFTPEDIAKNYINEVTSLMSIKPEIHTELRGKNLYIKLTGKNMGILIGKRGQTLESLQYLTSLVVNKGKSPYINIILDIENYREKRIRTLELLATNLAKKVKSTNNDVVLEPMTPFERRVIHSILEKDKDVYTYSQGKEPYRNVIIAVK